MHSRSPEAREALMRGKDPQRVTAATRLVCLLGHPVGHSRSPVMHNAAFLAQGIDMRYLAFDVLPEALPAAVAGLRALGVVGANVTVPHKETVVPLLDAVDPLALRIGAVNTIVNRQGVLTGYNTDIDGFLTALEQAGGRSPRGAHCLVLGAGGAARAVVAGLAQAGASDIVVYNRTASRARDLCAAAESWSMAPCHPVGESGLRRAAEEADIIVNATSLGLGDTVKLSPLPVDTIRGRQVIMDLTYGPRPTALIQRARSVGAIGVDGVEMLVQQAAGSYYLWTGRPAPVERMRDEVQNS